MKNINNKNFAIAPDHLHSLLAKAKLEERRDRALVVSIRLEALAIHITQSSLSGIEAADLLRREAARYDHESQELH